MFKFDEADRITDGQNIYIITHLFQCVKSGISYYAITHSTDNHIVLKVACLVETSFNMVI